MAKEREYEFECSAQHAGADYTVQLTGFIKKNNSNAAKAVLALLAGQPDGSKLKVRLVDFYGGDIREGLAIHKELKARNAPMEVDGLVASMGTVIMCAGAPVTATKRMKAMMHRASAKVEEADADDLLEVAAELKGLEGELVSILAERAGLTDESARAKMLVKGKDTWFTAEQLMELGLVDAVVPSVVRTVPLREASKLTTPNALLARFAACYTDEQTPGTGTTKAMNKEITAALGLAEGADDVAVKNGIEALNKQVAELKAAAAERDKLDKQRELDAALKGIDDALKADRITKAQAESLKEDAKTAPGVVAKTVATLTASLPAHKSLTGQLTAQEGKASKSLEAVYEKRDHEGWDFIKWSKEDPRGLDKLREEHKELYAELRKTLNQD